MADLVSMPKLGFDMAEGTLVRWVRNEGEQVEKGAVLAEIETDKATVEVESSFNGVILRLLVEPGTVVPVNTPIAVIGAPEEKIDLPTLLGKITPSKPAEKGQTQEDTQGLKAESVKDRSSLQATQLPGGVRASPLARKMADERGIDLRNVIGSGPQGRITKEDIESLFEARSEAVNASQPTSPMPVHGIRPERRVPLTRLRAIIGRRMVESTNNAPHFFITHEYDMAALMELRSQLNQMLPEEEKTSVNDYIVKAVGLTLLEFPNLNASFDEAKGEIIQHGRINVGVAVGVENGLLTVVCQDTDQKGVRQISAELGAMIKRAREGKVRPDDIEGSTFSVSNLGMYEVEQFSAIINPPEAAILAVGAVRQTPVVVDGEFRIGTRLKATLSVDHRVSDGVEGAKFMQALARYLEQPLRLIIDLPLAL